MIIVIVVVVVVVGIQIGARQVRVRRQAELAPHRGAHLAAS